MITSLEPYLPTYLHSSPLDILTHCRTIMMAAIHAHNIRTKFPGPQLGSLESWERSCLFQELFRPTAIVRTAVDEQKRCAVCNLM